MSMSDIDLFEVNEAFAAVPMWYMREMPTTVAPLYTPTGMSQADHHCFGHFVLDSLATAAANANAVVVCPEGNELRS